MRWADELEQHAKKAKARKGKSVLGNQKTEKRTGPPPVVHEFYITVRGASENDPGQIDVGFYVVENGQVTLTDAAGKPLKDAKSEALPNGMDPRTIAVGMLRNRRTESNEDFRRALYQEPRKGWR